MSWGRFDTPSCSYLFLILVFILFPHTQTLYVRLKKICGLVPLFLATGGALKKTTPQGAQGERADGAHKGRTGRNAGGRPHRCGWARKAGLLCTTRGRTRKPRPWAHKGAQGAHKSLRVLVPGRGGFSTVVLDCAYVLSMHFFVPFCFILGRALEPTARTLSAGVFS